MLERSAEERKDAKVVVEEVKYPEQLERLDGLVIPGGESTTLSVFLRENGFGEKLRWFAREGEGRRCVWGTCAGLILLADQLDSQKQGGQITVDTMVQCNPLYILYIPSFSLRCCNASNTHDPPFLSLSLQLGGIDVQATRNAYGKQINSFEALLKIKDSALFRQATPPGSTHQPHDECLGVFIRAPGIVCVNSSLVQTLATLDRGSGEVAVGVRQGHLMATSFHPELTPDPRWHSYFIGMVLANKSAT